MAKTKVLELDEKMEQSLTNVCDAALKYCGLQIMSTVSELAAAIRDSKEED